MKQVFVTKCGAAWEVIDKATEEVIDVVDDVLIFNGVYKRFNNKRGWHGILSEELNFSIIDLIRGTNFLKVVHKTTPYYPRYNDLPIKKAGYVHFKGDATFVSKVGVMFNDSKLQLLCAPWETPYDDEDDWVDFNDEDDDDY